MIPSLILFGVIFGRWWRPVLASAPVGWPLVVVTTNATDLSESTMLLGAGLFGVANAGLGVLAHQSYLRLPRLARPSGDGDRLRKQSR
jgi:hypothetical protein